MQEVRNRYASLHIPIDVLPRALEKEIKKGQVFANNLVWAKGLCSFLNSGCIPFSAWKLCSRCECLKVMDCNPTSVLLGQTSDS